MLFIVISLFLIIVALALCIFLYLSRTPNNPCAKATTCPHVKECINQSEMLCYKGKER